MEAIKLHSLRQLEENVEKTRKPFIKFVEGYLSRCHRSDRYKLMYQNTMNHISGFCEFYDISNTSEYRGKKMPQHCQDICSFNKKCFVLKISRMDRAKQRNRKYVFRSR